MSNLEKVLDVWMRLESQYSAKGSGLSRREFLLKLIGSDNAVFNMRKMIMRDFVSTEDNVARLNELMNVVTSAAERLQAVQDIADLDEFVWGSKVLKPEEYQSIFVREPVYLELSEALLQHRYVSEYEADSELLLPREHDGFLHFEDSDGVVLWLYQHYPDFGRDAFEAQAYAYLVRCVAMKDVNVPVTVVRKDLLPFSYVADSKIREEKSYPILSKGRFDCCLCADMFRDCDTKRNELVVVVSSNE